jgi:hypothetical protein
MSAMKTGGRILFRIMRVVAGLLIACFLLFAAYRALQGLGEAIVYHDPVTFIGVVGFVLLIFWPIHAWWNRGDRGD